MALAVATVVVIIVVHHLVDKLSQLVGRHRLGFFVPAILQAHLFSNRFHVRSPALDGVRVREMILRPRSAARAA